MVMCKVALTVMVIMSACVVAHDSFHVDPQDEHMKEHLKEHLDDVADGVELDTEEDVYFGYFNVHDTDKSGYMDGLELLHSFGDHKSSKPGEMYTDELYEKNLQGYVEIVDITLKEFDTNNDGLISFPEYMGQMKSGPKPSQ